MNPDPIRNLNPSALTPLTGDSNIPPAPPSPSTPPSQSGRFVRATRSPQAGTQAGPAQNIQSSFALGPGRPPVTAPKMMPPPVKITASRVEPQSLMTDGELKAYNLGIAHAIRLVELYGQENRTISEDAVTLCRVATRGKPRTEAMKIAEKCAVDEHTHKSMWHAACHMSENLRGMMRKYGGTPTTGGSGSGASSHNGIGRPPAGGRQRQD